MALEHGAPIEKGCQSKDAGGEKDAAAWFGRRRSGDAQFLPKVIDSIIENYVTFAVYGKYTGKSLKVK
jgi:hypothetical protein